MFMLNISVEYRALCMHSCFIEQIKEVKLEGITIVTSSSPPGPSRYAFKKWEEGKRNLNNIIDLIIEELEQVVPEKPVSDETQGDTLKVFRQKDNSLFSDVLDRWRTSVQERPESEPESKRVFVVHGHDEEMKQSVARTLQQHKLEPIILHEQPNRGRTLIEKFEEEASDVGFAVVIFSPDDEGRIRGEGNLRPRARQNVVLELGFFFGKLGRGSVFVLYREIEGFELPSDIAGVLYVPYDRAGAWKVDLLVGA